MCECSKNPTTTVTSSTGFATASNFSISVIGLTVEQKTELLRVLTSAMSYGSDRLYRKDSIDAIEAKVVELVKSITV